MSEGDPRPEPGRGFHVTALLVASERALNNALDELGFAEDDDRVIEHESRVAFLTCSHEKDCDDLFALIAELASRGESWELQFRIDTDQKRAIFQTMARHRPVEAAELPLDDETEETPPDVPAQDLDDEKGRAAFGRTVKRLDAGAVFATLRPGPGDRATAWIIERGTRRVLAAATAADETVLRTALREFLPRIMFDVAMRPRG
jgi:hypothetical protein